MKSFFTWLVLQCLFARILFGIAIELWRSIHFTGSDAIGYFIIPVVLICIAETVCSALILYDLVMKPVGLDHEMRKLEFFATHPELARGRNF